MCGCTSREESRGRVRASVKVRRAHGFPNLCFSKRPHAKIVREIEQTCPPPKEACMCLQRCACNPMCLHAENLSGRRKCGLLIFQWSAMRVGLCTACIPPTRAPTRATMRWMVFATMADQARMIMSASSAAIAPTVARGGHHRLPCCHHRLPCRQRRPGHQRHPHRLHGRQCARFPSA